MTTPHLFGPFRGSWTAGVCLLCLFISNGWAWGATPEEADAVLRPTRFGGGIVVHVGSGDGELTAALARKGRLVLGLDRSAEAVAKAKQAHAQQDGYGDYSFAHWNTKHIPMVDNSVNALVIAASESVSEKEILRVLTPGGAAVIRTTPPQVIRKPVPESIDDWTHYLHDPSGNAVAHDDVVGPPRRLQWLGRPRWSRHHDRMASMSALVSAKGRLFYIMDEGSRVSIQLPAKWMLIARDAFNGVEIWRQPIKNWQSHLWPLKSGPTQLARRLVATDEHVFATLAFEAPLTQLDADTGEVLHTFEGTKSTEELLHVDGTLLVQVNQGVSDLAKYSPEHNVGDQRRVASEFVWNGGPRWLKAIDVETKETLWAVETPMAPLSLSASEDFVLYHTGAELVCRERKTGKQRWSKPAARRDAIANHFGPKIVIYEGVVLYTGGDRNLRAFDAASGEQLWTAPKPPSAYQSPEDLLVVGGLVWTAPTTSGRDTGTFVGRDPRSGEVKKEFSPNVDTYWFHHRCYIAKATDNYIIPSRTGIEFVDFNKQDWDIHHWVRGGCLYGVLPANGLLYAPPHNCACYPEAKLFGFNAMAPAANESSIQVADEPLNPLTKGPAYGKVEADESQADAGWPTFRHDNQRSGATDSKLADDLTTAWTVDLGGRLTAPVAANGNVYVAQTDKHTLHALDGQSGQSKWKFIAGGRIDSPPTLADGHVIFGSADGNVYCLRASDGELAWQLQAAPEQQRLMVFGQLESVWPVHGSVMVEDGAAYFVAGRSNFLDGGLWWFKLELKTGAIITRRRITDVDPTNGADLQDRLQTLQMPVGLPDILSTDGRRVYMRSQAFDFDGNRQDIGPISGNPAEHASVQQGETAHLFAPMGFLDGTWFHRSYWVYGRNFAGGHNGYYQAGRFAPAGRILVSDKDRVYGFGRKPQYLKWTTTIEHQLFSADKIQESPPASAIKGRTGGGRSNGSMVRVPLAKHLNPVGKSLTLAGWVKAQRPAGVIAARGGPADGYAIHLDAGKPVFSVRRKGELIQARAQKRVTGRWSHVAGVLDEEHMTLYLDGQQVAQVKSPGLLTLNPKQAMEVGADDGGGVAKYQSPAALTGTIDDVRLYHAALSKDELLKLVDGEATTAKPVLHLSFDKGDASDTSENKHHASLQNAKTGPGKLGRGVVLSGARRGGGNSQSKSTYVKHNWTLDLPVFARAMTLADDKLLICGPPDVMDEEQTFQQLVQRDEKVKPLLAKQQAALEGGMGGKLLLVSKEQGVNLDTVDLAALPVWDGMIVAEGRVIIANVKGQVQCLAAER